VGAIKQAFAQIGLQLLAAVLVTMFSLFLLSRQSRMTRPYLYRTLMDKVDEMFVGFEWSPTHVFRVGIKTLLVIFSLKRRSVLGYGDIAISLGVFALAIPTVLDIVGAAIQLARDVLLTIRGG
jgi:hypothetical protein